MLVLPLATTIDAGDEPAHFALSPLLETSSVEILTACSHAPNQILLGAHFENTNRAIAFDGFANNLAAWVIRLILVVTEVRGTSNWGVGEYLF